MDERAVLTQEQMRYAKLEFEEDLVRCAGSSMFTANFLMPDHFYLPWSKHIHYEIFKAIDDPNIRQLAIAAPRGCGKTSIIGRAVPCKHILFNQSNYIVYISETEDQAEMQTENLKEELEENDDILKFFGTQKTDKWAKGRWTTRNGTTVVPKGRGQKIRGQLERSFRPDFILLDDIENPDDAMSEAYRKKTRSWFYGSIKKLRGEEGLDFKIIVIGTICHEDCLLQRLLDDPAWYSLQLSLMGPNGESLWPDKISTQSLRDEYEEYKRQGMLTEFYMENCSTIVPSGDAGFKAEYFRYYTPEDLAGKFLEKLILVDPSRTKKEDSSNTAIVCLGIDVRGNRIFVMDHYADKMNPDEIVVNTIDMADNNGARVIGLEVTGLKEWARFPFENEMRRRGKRYELVELNHRGSKEERIRALLLFFRLGEIYFNANGCCSQIEKELISFPRSATLDSADCLSFFCPMMEAGGRYFYDSSDSYEEDEAEIERELHELEMDESQELVRMPSDWGCNCP